MRSKLAMLLVPLAIGCKADDPDPTLTRFESCDAMQDYMQEVARQEAQYRFAVDIDFSVSNDMALADKGETVSMDEAGGQRPGEIFRTRPDGVTDRVIEGIHIANSLAMSPDRRRLYLADSLERTIWTYDTADLARREVFARVADGDPDGSCIDAEGYLWNAQWAASRLVRYAPDRRIDRVVDLPVQQPSCCMFGGPDLATLYVTSAWDGLTEEDRAQEPLAGALFALDPGVKGLALPLFAG